MTFPESNRIVFAKNPLVEVICQLRFPTILEITAVEPALFQKQIREAYPLYEFDQPKVPEQVAQVIGPLPLPVPGTHKFSTENGAKSISISADFVAFTDKDYDDWENFSREVERARRALEDTYKPAFYARIGLRYRDVIEREQLGVGSEPWNELLQPALIGLLGAQDGIGDSVSEIRTQASFDLKTESKAKATVRHGLIRRSPEAGLSYLIDMDIYTEERTESKDVNKILVEFNKMAGNFFRWSITPRLRDALGRRQDS
jgi:uncharacterized protein (TIGR04255 family)